MLRNMKEKKTKTKS